MLCLLFNLGAETYAIETRLVERVLPLVTVRPIPQMPAGIAGLLNYGGRPVPVLDLCALVLGRPAQQRLSTRIVLIRYPQEEGGELLGLIAENATDTLRLQAQDFAPSGLRSTSAPYLGEVAVRGRRLVQRLEPVLLLPPAVRAALFPEAAA